MSKHDEPAHSPIAEPVLRYRCVAASIEGFVQQVAVSYIRTGHFFFVAGMLKSRVNPRDIDAKLILKYGVDATRWARALRKSRGDANLQYIRHNQFFLLMATHGKGLFFELEGEQVKDCRREPIKFAGYSLSYRGGHAHVRIELGTYLSFKAAMVEQAITLDREGVEELLATPWFVPYAPVRRQLWNVWREVNRTRSAAGLEPLGEDCLNLRRSIVRPFGDSLASLGDQPTERVQNVSRVASPTGISSLEGEIHVPGFGWEHLSGPSEFPSAVVPFSAPYLVLPNPSSSPSGGEDVPRREHPGPAAKLHPATPVEFGQPISTGCGLPLNLTSEVTDNVLQPALSCHTLEDLPSTHGPRQPSEQKDRNPTP